MKTLLTAALSLFIIMLTGTTACDSQTYQSKTSSSEGSQSRTVTVYDPYDFEDSCSKNLGVPPANKIAPAEGSFGITCQDNWVEVSNPDETEDVEQGDLDRAKGLDSNITSKRTYLERALALCNGWCAKKLNGQIYINKPNCFKESWCGKKKYKLKIGGIEKEAYFHSVCPKNHWKNVFKAKIGDGTNHCASPFHVDVGNEFSGSFGLTTGNQETKRATVTEVSNPSQNSPGQGGQGGQGGSGRGSQSSCYDKQTPNHTCTQQKDWGKCNENWLINGGFCKATCGRCQSKRP